MEYVMWKPSKERVSDVTCQVTAPYAPDPSTHRAAGKTARFLPGDQPASPGPGVGICPQEFETKADFHVTGPETCKTQVLFLQWGQQKTES